MFLSLLFKIDISGNTKKKVLKVRFTNRSTFKQVSVFQQFCRCLFFKLLDSLKLQHFNSLESFKAFSLSIFHSAFQQFGRICNALIKYKIRSTLNFKKKMYFLMKNHSHNCLFIRRIKYQFVIFTNSSNIYTVEK
jgi:hypothetical protein